MNGIATGWGGAPGRLLRRGDIRWLVIWLAGLGLLWLWDAANLNRPAFQLLQRGFVNSLLAGAITVVVALVLGWTAGVSLYFLRSRGHHLAHLALTFLLNLVRSVPQIIGILVGYVVLTVLIERDLLRNQYAQIAWTAMLISLVTFVELVDVITERIEHFRKSDFFNALRCCGISESRIVNVDILWKNSPAHILHKLIGLFGMAIFLQCSIDFVISVGLSTDVSLSNFPATLGGLLATLDSKQDILALSVLMSDLSYITEIPFRHLQGLSVAFLIVFTLVCVYRIGNAFVKRHHL